jgi:hypothetical protein
MTKTRELISGSTGFFAIGAIVVLAVSLKALAQAAPSDLPAVSTISVTGYQLVSQKRVSRTGFEYTYRVTVRNSGPALIVLSGRASATSAALTVPDDAMSFGDIASGGAANSTDTFTIRQDRTQPFSTNDLSWVFTAAPGEGIAPDPGATAELTLAGVDADADGVRDDIERYIAITYPTSTRRRSAALQLARALQPAIATELSVPQANATAMSLRAAGRCAAVTDMPGSERLITHVQSQAFNTFDRLRAYERFEVQYAGEVLWDSDEPAGSSACVTDPATFPN